MKMQSRREQIVKRRYERNIIIIFVGIIVLLVVFFFYGIQLLINVSILIGNLSGGNDTSSSISKPSLIVPPIFNPIQDATNSAKIVISGTAYSGQIVKLYLNGKYTDKITINNDNSFMFENIILEEGNNSIKALVTGSDNQESDYSQELRITYKNKTPNLQINSPQDKQIFSGTSQIKVEGKSDAGVHVTINGYWAIIDNTGNFSYLLNLQKGENKIKVIAVDDAGNETAKEIIVTLNQ